MFSYVKKKQKPSHPSISTLKSRRAALHHRFISTGLADPRRPFKWEPDGDPSPQPPHPSPRPDPAAPTPSSLMPCCRASAIHISSRIQRGGAGGSGGINKSEPTGSDVTRRHRTSHLFFPILLEVESFPQVFIVFAKWAVVLNEGQGSAPRHREQLGGSLDSSS